MSAEDPRKAALKSGLRQLRSHELRWLLRRSVDYPDAPILLDRDESGNANFSNGVYCPLAVAVVVPLHRAVYDGHDLNSDSGVAAFLTESCGFAINNTRGVVGEFYTTNRREDLLTAAREVLGERCEERR